MDKFQKAKQIIVDFENQKESLEGTKSSLKEFISKDISAYEISNYWRSESLDSFVKRLIASAISDWETIDDVRAIELINEILLNINDDSLINTNSEALEKRFSKPSGTVSDLIFQEDLTDSKVILERLKRNNTLLL